MTDEECKQLLDSVGGYDEAKKILTMMSMLRIEVLNRVSDTLYKKELLQVCKWYDDQKKMRVITSSGESVLKESDLGLSNFKHLKRIHKYLFKDI